jgi:hypothetical protein
MLSVCCPIGENFLYVFKGARSAPRAWRRVTVHAATTGELAHAAEPGRDAPAGEPAPPPGGRSP